MKQSNSLEDLPNFGNAIGSQGIVIYSLILCEDHRLHFFHPQIGVPMSHLLESIEDGIATLTMNRPEARNAMNAEIIDGLQAALPRLGADNDVRCVVLTGANGAFCAGGDVKGFASGTVSYTHLTLPTKA